MFVLLSFLLGTAHAENVNQIAAGSWASAGVPFPGGTSTRYNIWVDVAIYNLAYDKNVGIRWTDDNWATSHDAAAWYEGSLGGGWEQWGVDIAPLGALATEPGAMKWANRYGSTRYVTGPVTIDYAVYYRAAGGEWWDNNGGANYHLTLW